MNETHPAGAPLVGLSAQAMSVWAKSGDGTEWLPLPQHMIDSADVAGLLWDQWASPQLRARCAQACGFSEDDARTLLRWLACCHDVGKASKAFATQLDRRPGYERLSQRMAEAGLPMNESTLEALNHAPHGTMSRQIMVSWLEQDAGFHPRAAQALAAVVDAHHGASSDEQKRKRAEVSFVNHESEWHSVWQELLEFATDYVSAQDVLEQLRARGRRGIPATAQMLLCGFVIMADWMASDEHAFPFVDHRPQDKRVNSGYRAEELPGPWCAHVPGTIDELFADRFDLPADARPRPVQIAVAEACQSLTSPGIVLVEAPTGEGKTEAALLGAELAAAANGAGGVFFGAPTMSTSDALFQRILAWARRAVPGGAVASMFLAHSKSALNIDYARLRALRNESTVDEQNAHEAVVASRWLLSRKKGPLADFVVGTVDQLLIMALQSRHSMLRHLAFAGKIVIIDEVHAYDAYMNQYFHRALEWLAAYGATVILLSATLPLETKRGLLEAYGRGISAEVPNRLSEAYPLVTVLSANKEIHELPVASRPENAVVKTEFIRDDLKTLVSILQKETQDGGCVLVLCNSVRRAQDAFAALPRDLRADATLVHARFTAVDRLSREAALIRALGPRAHRGSGRPRRSILIATQVAEQSLDIDVDLLITDIAPIDLMLQRMGRLHRHARPERDRPSGLLSPRMLVRGVIRDAPVPQFDAASAAIYGEKPLFAAYLLLGEKVSTAGIARPAEVPVLVQRAYGDRFEVPAAWEDAWMKAGDEFQQKRQSAERRATQYRIGSPGDIALMRQLFEQQESDVANSAAAEERGYAQVRDTEVTIEVVLTIDRGEGCYGVLPWLDGSKTVLFDETELDYQTAFTLATSTVRLPRRISHWHFEEAVESLERATPIAWRNDPLLRGMIALRLDEQLTANVAGICLKYDRDLGLLEQGVSEQPSKDSMDNITEIDK